MSVHPLVQQSPGTSGPGSHSSPGSRMPSPQAAPATWVRSISPMHAAAGLSRERIVAAYQELELGIMCTVHPHTQNANLLKAPPFSSYPTQAELHVDGRFHSWAGCAMESLAACMMPPFAGK